MMLCEIVSISLIQINKSHDKLLWQNGYFRSEACYLFS